MNTNELQVLIPVIRKAIPSFFARDVTNVQPMGVDAQESYHELLRISKTPVSSYRQGERIHDFSRGWLRYYGKDLIPESLWWQIKIKGL